MPLWTPGDLDIHTIHGAPVPLDMGSDPFDYTHKGLRKYVAFVCFTCRANHTAPNGVVFQYSMQDIKHTDGIPDKIRSELFLKAVDNFASKGPTLWHCQAGLNRSGYMIAAYLHLYRGMHITKAISLMRNARSDRVLFNDTFENALLHRYSG